MTTKVIFLTSGTSWTVPADWNSASNTVACIGGGGGGCAGKTGGGGGAYAATSNVSLTPGGSAGYAVGAGGAADLTGVAAQAGGQTWFGSTGTVAANGGSGGTAAAGGAGGSGGAHPVSSGGSGSNRPPGAGGGGAGGPNGTGNNGSGFAGGSGDAGSGGAGGSGGTPNGSPGAEWTSTVDGSTAGSGGGGAAGGTAGLYGAGGSNGGAGVASAGAPGLIVITYTPAAALAAAQASFALTGQAAGLKRARVLTASAASFAASGVSVGLKTGRALLAGAAAFVLSGQSVAFAGAIPIHASVGAFALSGSDARLAMDRRAAVGAGSFALSGSAATLSRTSLDFPLTAAAGAFSLSGNVAALRAGRRLLLGAGSFTASGLVAALGDGWRMPAQARSFSLAGQGASLRYGHTLAVARGVFALSGQAASLATTHLGATGDYWLVIGTATASARFSGWASPTDGPVFLAQYDWGARQWSAVDSTNAKYPFTPDASDTILARVSRVSPSSDGIEKLSSYVADTKTTALPAPTGLATAQKLKKQSDGSTDLKLVITCNTSSATDLGGYAFEVTRTPAGELAETAEVMQRKTARCTIQAVVGDLYSVRAALVDEDGNIGTWSSPVTRTPTGDSTAPGAVTVTTAPTARPKGVLMKVTAPSDANFGGIAFYYNTTNNSATATLLDFVPGKPGKRIKYRDDDAHTAGDTLYYWAASVNLDGVESATRTSLGGPVTYALVDLVNDVANKSLANLDGVADTKLGGIDAGATVGATAGANLKDSGGSTLGDNDVKNTKGHERGTFNRNPTFQRWTGSAGSPPDNYTKVGLTGHTISQMTTSPRYGDWAFRVVNTAGNTAYSTADVASGELRLMAEQDYVALDLDFDLISGSDLQRAGVFLEVYYNGGTSNLKRYVLADLNALFPSASTGHYEDSFVSGVTATVGTPTGAPTSAKLFVCNANSTLSGGSSSAKTIDWNQVRVRRATRQEIKTAKALDDNGQLDTATGLKNKSLANLDSTADTKLSGIATGATKNVTYRQTTAPTGGTYTTGDTWIDTSSSPRVHYMWTGSAWEAVGRNATTTSQLTDTANLGGTATAAGVSGAGNLITKNLYDINNIKTLTAGANTLQIGVDPTRAVYSASANSTVTLKAAGATQGDQFEVINLTSDWTLTPKDDGGTSIVNPLGSTGVPQGSGCVYKFVSGAWVAIYLFYVVQSNGKANPAITGALEAAASLADVSSVAQARANLFIRGRTFYNTDATKAITWGTDGPWFRWGGSIGANRNLNLIQGTAAAGDAFFISRVATGAFNVVVRDQASATTICSLPAPTSTVSWCVAIWNGTGFECAMAGNF